MISSYSLDAPPEQSQMRQIRSFTESMLEAATVVLPFSVYRASKHWAIQWEDNKVAAAVFYNIKTIRDLRIVHLAGMFVETKLRRVFGPRVLLQHIVAEIYDGKTPLHWCFRTRNPLLRTATLRYKHVMVRHKDASIQKDIALACFGEKAMYTPKTGLLSNSYPKESQFIIPNSRKQIPGLAYSENQSLCMTGFFETNHTEQYLENPKQAYDNVLHTNT